MPVIQILAEKETGKRTINGAEFPVKNQLTRDYSSKSKPWLVSYQVCNGTADGSENFKTKREALEAL